MSEPTAVAPVCYRHTDRETWIRCQRCERPICPDCMLPASVGFQCPSCVKDGAKQTRTGRLPYGGERSANPALTSQVLIGINAIVWLMITASGRGTSKLVDALALLPQTTLFESRSGVITLVDGVSGGAYWQVVTAGFTHVEIWHIALNMLALFYLGPQLELILGRARFLAVYLGSLLTSSAAVMLLSGEHSQTVGASGALFGMMGALLVVALKVRSNVQPILTWVGINVVFTFVAGSFISWQGHAGGLLGGFVLAGAIVFAPKGKQHALLQWSAVAAVSAVSVVLILIRAAALA